MNQHRWLAAGWPILFFGAAWGAAESTLGHLLHLLPVPGLAGAVMFPVACLAMMHAFCLTRRPLAVFATATVAAALKMADLLLPGNPAAVVNPAMAILLQGLALFGFCRRFGRSSITPVMAGLLAFGWRAAYLATSLVMALAFLHAGIARQGIPAMIQFLFLESVPAAALLALASRTRFWPGRREAAPKPEIGPAAAFLMLFLACICAIAFN